MIGGSLPEGQLDLARWETWKTNHVGQIDWLLRYVKSRYGTFYSAWVWWSTHAWY
jgi:hypothetical protein